MMLRPPLLHGLRAMTVATPRLHTHVITNNLDSGPPVVFVHGNCSAARFWEETLVATPQPFRPIAPDLRGFGRSQAAAVNAIRGMRDFSDDVYALIVTLNLPRIHLVGWSLGGCVAMQLAIDHPELLASLTLVAPGSPYGIGGSRDVGGTPTLPSYAGTGAGSVHHEFVMRIAAQDRTAESRLSPRNVLNAAYFKPPFRSPREEIFVDEILTTTCGFDNFPGDITLVPSWPGIAPGTRGVSNALSPKYCRLESFATIKPHVPVLWIRGDSDKVVSDSAPFYGGNFGRMQMLMRWPRPQLFLPQPMVQQMRAVLERYQTHGGTYQEVVIANCGHSPHIEQPNAFRAALFSFLEQWLG